MSPIVIKSPNSDEVWSSWKRKASKSQNLEKHYGIKGAVFNLDNITAAEFVKGVNKAAIIYFEKNYEVKVVVSGKMEKMQKNAKDIEKVKFYQFKKQPIKSEWKGSEEYPDFLSLKQIPCSKCGGKGGISCKKCNGAKLIACPDCKGTQKACKKCDGTGKYTVEIRSSNEKEDKTSKKIAINCNSCFGSAKINCTSCGGTGKIPCKACNSIGLNSCSECNGHGVLFNYIIKPVPFLSEFGSEPMILSSVKLSGLEKELGKEIQKTIEQVEGIIIKNPEKELDQKFVEPNLGYFSKEIAKIIKESEKEWKNANKDKDTKIKLPIFLFPVLALDCVTKKGKSFQVLAIGSDKKFQVFGKI